MASGVINYNNQNKMISIIDNIRNCIGGDIKYESAFTQYPSKWLGQNSSTTFKKVQILNSSDIQYAPPIYEGNYLAWWNVITFGVGNRCTQVAFYGFNISKATVIYIRRQHDSNVSDWINITTDNNLDWKLLGEYQFKATATLPSSFKELNIFTRVNGYNFNFLINRTELTTTAKAYLHGSYWSSTNNYGVHINVSSESVYFSNCVYNSVIDNSATMRIYYR